MKNHLTIAESLYKAIAERNLDVIEKILHENVQFVAPLAQAEGKEAVLEATKRFCHFFKSLTIRAKLCSEDQAMIVYDVDCPVGHLSSASLLTFKDNLVKKMELFYDARPFEKKKEDASLEVAKA